jgi:mannose-1-phosphate guanylyltransferase
MKALLLAAGFGARLQPLTESWPKCLMPIHGRPLLEYWLGILKQQGIHDVLVNRHHYADIVNGFLQRPQFKDWVRSTYEPELFGTAGTLRKNSDYFREDTVLMAHADNWTCCDFSDFISYHHNRRPQRAVITMMIFDCTMPTSCGIVELDHEGLVVGFHEKVKNPPGSLANAAVYLIEPEILDWIENNPHVTDFSTEVLPHFIGRIATWKNNFIHKDIGTIEMLIKAQFDSCDPLPWDGQDLWQRDFMKHSIHELISSFELKESF